MGYIQITVSFKKNIACFTFHLLTWDFLHILDFQQTTHSVGNVLHSGDGWESNIHNIREERLEPAVASYNSLPANSIVDTMEMYWQDVMLSLFGQLSTGITVAKHTNCFLNSVTVNNFQIFFVYNILLKNTLHFFIYIYIMQTYTVAYILIVTYCILWITFHYLLMKQITVNA